LLRSEGLQSAVAPAFSLEQRVSLFRYREGRDLTGYVDGTENPEGQRAREVALCGGEPGYAGGSFVAVQKWVHDLDLFATFDQRRKDLTFGRRLSDNEEIDDAPPTAHVKRTAQESFDPEAFILRRSMPFADEAERGLVFIAFGRSLDLYEALLRRMVGEEDGVADALFEFTRPVTGSYFWCPPTKDRQLDLSALGL
jgi:putative iron-dependent peroxidase